MKDNIKRRFGDTKDGRLIKGEELDTNHYIMPLVWPRRTDNEAFVSEKIDLTEVNKYLKKKNEITGKNYTIFMVILAAISKVFVNRSRMNRFFRNGRLYERYKLNIGFMVRKTISDNSEEALGRVFVENNDNFESLSNKILSEIEDRRGEEMDKTSDDIRILMKFPHFIGKLFLGLLKLMDKLGPVPESISSSDLFFTSIVCSHLGSVGLHSGYHHLSNWGTNSFFMTLGERKFRPFYDKEGNCEVKDSIDLGMTIDERIADGLYFARSIRLMKRYLANPELLDSNFKD